MRNLWLLLSTLLLLVLLLMMPEAKGKDYYQQFEKNPGKIYALEKLYLEDSLQWAQKKQYSIALNACSYVLKTYPNHPRGLNMLIGFARAGLPVAMIKPYFDRAIQVSPKQSMTYFLFGKLHQDTGDAAAAIPFYNQAIAQDPNRGFYYYALAEVYLATEQIALAQTALQHALGLNFDISKLQATLQQ
jgi:tetratricopeptide (TPR) repeat protein